MNKIFSKTQKKAESLIEVMVAIALFSIMIVPIFGMIGSVLSLSVYFRERVEALSLAQEGLEGFRNIRDTNWLRFSGTKDQDWLCIERDTNNTCSNRITTHSPYVIDFNDTTKEYFLSNITGSIIDYETPFLNCSNCLVYVNETDHLYTHSNPGTEGSPTIYYRQIIVEPSDDEVCTVGCKTQKVKVSSEVFWKDSVNGTIRKDRLQMELFNFLDRTNYPE